MWFFAVEFAVFCLAMLRWTLDQQPGEIWCKMFAKKCTTSVGGGEAATPTATKPKSTEERTKPPPKKKRRQFSCATATQRRTNTGHDYPKREGTETRTPVAPWNRPMVTKGTWCGSFCASCVTMAATLEPEWPKPNKKKKKKKDEETWRVCLCLASENEEARMHERGGKERERVGLFCFFGLFGLCNHKSTAESG